MRIVGDIVCSKREDDGWEGQVGYGYAVGGDHKTLEGED